MRLRFAPSALLLGAVVSCQTADERPDTASVDAPATAASASEDPAGPLGLDPLAEQPVVTTAPVEASAPQGGVDEGADKVQLRRQRGRALATEYVARGQEELERADFQAALSSFASALELDPLNESAREGLRRVETLLGDKYQSAASAFDDEVERAMVRRAQARLSITQFTNAGDQALREGRYDDAIEEYRQAETVLRWHPMIASDSLDERIIRGKVSEATSLRDDAVEASSRLEREAAQRERQAAEAAQVERRENKIREYYERANQAFVSDQFGQAETWCKLILHEDPGNAAATKLLDSARELRHHKADEENRRHYREQWLRTFEDLDTLNVPQTDALKYTLERWAEVRQRQPLEHGNLDLGAREERQAVMSRLEEFRFAPNFGGPDGEGSPLEEVADYMQSFTGVNFWISNAVKDDLGEEETAIVLQLPTRSVRKVLDIIAETSESLRWKIEDGVVKFVTAEELLGGQLLETYSVQDLLHPVPNYQGREINISPSGGLTPPDEELEEREANVVTPTLLEDLIRNNINPESWDNDPNNSIQITDSGQLVVNQTPDVHGKIQRLLEDLREATGIMVDIQARFLKVEDNFLEDIGVDFRGLGQPGLGQNGFDFNDFGDASTQNDLGSEIGQGTDLGAFYDDGEDGDVRARVEELYDFSLGDEDVLLGSGGLAFQWTYLNDMEFELILRAVSKSERVELVTAPRILVHNASRANLAVLNQVAYVYDFDVEIAQGAAIADPQIQVIQDGVILDVRPVVSADRRFITMELRPTIAELERPIEQRITSIALNLPLTIQLPRVEIQRVRTSIPIPDGGTVLLGGMKVSEKQDFRNGVPILNKVPILSALFERKGSYNSNRKLLILLRANIVIPAEHEPSAAALGLDD